MPRGMARHASKTCPVSVPRVFWMAFGNTHVSVSHRAVPAQIFPPPWKSAQVSVRADSRTDARLVELIDRALADGRRWRQPFKDRSFAFYLHHAPIDLLDEAPLCSVVDTGLIARVAKRCKPLVRTLPRSRKLCASNASGVRLLGENVRREQDEQIALFRCLGAVLEQISDHRDITEQWHLANGYLFFVGDEAAR